MAGVALLEVFLGFLYNVTHSIDNLLFVGYFEFEKMFPMTGDDIALRGWVGRLILLLAVVATPLVE
jgi:hypothetical protein